MKNVTVFRDESCYPSHASVCQAANGDVLAAFRQAPFRHIFSHVDPESTVGLVRSQDGGETWDPKSRITIIDPGNETNLNDPSITVLRDGTLICTAFTAPAGYDGIKAKWGDLAKPVRGNDFCFVSEDRRILVTRSFDNGATWESPYEVTRTAYGEAKSAGVFGEVVELSDGTLLMPITHTAVGKLKRGAALIASRDKGKTWEYYSAITASEGEGEPPSFGLPSAVAYDDRHLAAVGWSNPDSGTAVTLSDDGGMTWGPTAAVETHGACMHLCLTRSGTTLMSYGYRHVPYGITVLPSYDRGKTWDMNNAASLRQDGAMRDLGYPWTVQLSDGRLFCVYYFNVDDEDRSYYNEKESLRLCAEWNLDPALYAYSIAGLRFIGGTFFTEEEVRDLAGTGRPGEEFHKPEPTLL